jgi:hypothetical protein
VKSRVGNGVVVTVWEWRQSSPVLRPVDVLTAKLNDSAFKLFEEAGVFVRKLKVD